VISDYTIEANADGEFDWSIDAQTTGAVTYTPAGP
jgi:predicted secreted protein